MEISAYLIEEPIEIILPRLLEKIYQTGQRCVLHVAPEDMVSFWDKTLWTYAQKSFLPHGSHMDGNASEQPIWITSVIENPNNSSIFVTTDPSCCISEVGFEKGIHIFPIQDKHGINLAKNYIKEYTHKGQEVKIWKQTSDRKWESLSSDQVKIFMC